MWNFVWLDVDSSLQTNDSTVLVIRLETILDDSDSRGLWLWLDKNDSGTPLLLNNLVGGIQSSSRPGHQQTSARRCLKFIVQGKHRRLSGSLGMSSSVLPVQLSSKTPPKENVLRAVLAFLE